MTRKNKEGYDPLVIKKELLLLRSEVGRLQEKMRSGLREHGKRDRSFSRVLENNHRTMNQILRLMASFALPPVPPIPEPPSEKKGKVEDSKTKSRKPQTGVVVESPPEILPYADFYAFSPDGFDFDEDEEE